jgi:ubiquinone/menaquinone biosynthesis C-methylase UbiE
VAESQVSHPIFARVFSRLSSLMEREIGDDRDELLAGLHGRVVEIGAGNGVNFRHYPETVGEVVALEPEAYMRARAQEAASGVAVPVRVLDGVAEQLPLENASCDAAVSSLVLCSVADAARVLGELRRVVKPGGQLRFIEHVRSNRPRHARIQIAADRTGIWPLLGGGCHCSRETLRAIEAAGFGIEGTRVLRLGPSWGLTHPHVMGFAS